MSLHLMQTLVLNDERNWRSGLRVRLLNSCMVTILFGFNQIGHEIVLVLNCLYKPYELWWQVLAINIRLRWGYMNEVSGILYFLFSWFHSFANAIMCLHLHLERCINSAYFFLISYFSAYLRGLLLETMVKACLAGLFFSFKNQCLYINWSSMHRVTVIRSCDSGAISAKD
jgi:hypothetical protein